MPWIRVNPSFESLMPNTSISKIFTRIIHDHEPGGEGGIMSMSIGPSRFWRRGIDGVWG